MTNWISVNDRLPEIDKRVLFWVKTRKSCNTCLGYIIPIENRGKDLDGKEFYWFVDESENTAFTFDEVSHWQLLPLNPEEE